MTWQIFMKNIFEIMHKNDIYNHKDILEHRYWKKHNFGYFGPCPNSWNYRKLNFKTKFGHEGGRRTLLNTHLYYTWSGSRAIIEFFENLKKNPSLAFEIINSLLNFVWKVAENWMRDFYVKTP